jgi:hypothetical protein
VVTDEPFSPADADAFDYGADGDPDQEVVARAFAELDKLTLQAERATAARKRAEDALQKCKQDEERLLQKEIPELLQRMRLSKCTTASGIEVSVKRDIKASLPGHDHVEKRMAAFQWLIDHGHGGVIKNNVTVVLDRGADERADALVVDLRAKGFDVDAKKDVHAGTLSALARESQANGTAMPRDRFNIYDLNVAKLSRRE